jgi:hypothetical protein
MTTFMRDKIYYKFGNEDTKFNAWATWAAASGSAEDKANAIKFSGRTIDFIISNKWLDSWPAPDPANNLYAFVTKWSGGCLRDYSSGMGGFCVFEDNDTAFYDCGRIDCMYSAPGQAEATACAPLAGTCSTPPAVGSNDEKRCTSKNSTKRELCG